MIKEKELPKAVVNNKLITHKATDLTIMSYDKNVHKLIIPTDLTQDQINDIIVLITFRYHENIIQISGELVEDKIEIILPNEIQSLSGEFYIEIDINLTDNRQITFARYSAKVVKSDIDSVDLDDAQEFYFELFDDFVQKVADKSEVVVAEIDAHKQSVSDKADTAIAVITDASDSVTTAKQSALTSIAQVTSDVTDASTQFITDLADTQSTIDAQVTQAQDSLQEVSDTLTAVNDKVTTVNDTADSFMADVADKSQLVDDKYNAFDTSVTTANQTIDEILGLADDVQQVSTQVAEKVQNFTVKNEVANGDFKDGLNSWLMGSSVGNVSQNEIEIKSDGTAAYSRLSNFNNVLIEKDSQIYAGVYLKNDSDSLTQVFIRNNQSTPLQYIVSKKIVEENYVFVSGVVKTTEKYDLGVRLYISVDYGNSANADNKIFNIKKPLLINMTEVFGAGYEPTKEEMDRLVAMIPNQWWDGELDLTQQQYVNWLLSFIREKANKSQEAWITPTLLNGYTSISPIAYMKDGLGFVHFKGRFGSSGTPESVAFTLPSEYRPNQYVLVAGASGKSNIVNYMITTSGNFSPYGVGGSIDGITYKAGE